MPAAKPNHARGSPWRSAALVAVAGAAAWLWSLPSRPALEPVRDPAAVAFYRSGLHEWQTRTPSGLVRAVRDFDAAIARDPGYAKAYEGLAQHLQSDARIHG